MNYFFPFKEVFLFEKFTSKHNDYDFLLRKINEKTSLNKNNGLVMVLRKENLGYFDYLILNNKKENGSFDFIEEGVRFDLKKGLIEAFNEFNKVKVSLNKNKRGAKFRINSKFRKVPYLVTDQPKIFYLDNVFLYNEGFYKIESKTL